MKGENNSKDDLHYAALAFFFGLGGATFGVLAFAFLAKLAQ